MKRLSIKDVVDVIKAEAPDLGRELIMRHLLEAIGANAESIADDLRYYKDQGRGEEE